jgi:heat shock protein HslJ
MKKLYWILIVIVIVIAIAEGYALYKIPKSEIINGHLNYEHSVEVEPGTVFKLSLESRALGENKFAILAASEFIQFTQFPQNFSLPVLSKSLSNLGIYQLRVRVFHQQKVLYTNKGLLPLTREDLDQPLNIDLQVPAKPRQKIIITSTVLPTSVVKKATQSTATSAQMEQKIVLPTVISPSVVQDVISSPTESPTVEKEKNQPTSELNKRDVKKLLAGKHWELQTKQDSKAHLVFETEKGYALGSGGCNNFQSGYQIEQSVIVFNLFIVSSKYCEKLMEVETYFLDSLPKVSNWLVKDEGQTLYLYDDDNQMLLKFVAK